MNLRESIFGESDAELIDSHEVEVRYQRNTAQHLPVCIMESGAHGNLKEHERCARSTFPRAFKAS